MSKPLSFVLLAFIGFQIAHLSLDLYANGQSQNAPEGYVELNIEGWNVTVENSLADKSNSSGAHAIEALRNHLQRVKYIVPTKRLKDLQQIKIWVDENYEGLRGMQYHPSKGWLENNGHNPALAQHVHIPQASALTARHMWAKHPYVVLHELSHGFHDQVLGFDHPDVARTYRNAKKSGKYDEVLDHRGKTVKHYGMNNPQEYFAESTEAYFGVNDFYPFVRAELKEHDPMMYSLLEKIWGKVE